MRDAFKTNNRAETCRHHDIKTVGLGQFAYFCAPDGCKTLGERWEREQRIDPDKCLTCDRYDSMYITYPITVSDIKVEQGKAWDLGLSPVAVRKAGDKDKKTYFGIYLGELPYRPQASYDRKTKVLTVSDMINPCIYIPETNEIVYGAESWWKIIWSLEEFEILSDETIRNQWYMKLLRRELEIRKEFDDE